jgi:uncharacterized protein (UPF0335 family)
MSEPLTSEQQHLLLDILNYISGEQLLGTISQNIITLLEEKFEAKFTTSGIYTRLRCAGVIGSSESGKADAVLGNWRTNALKALDGEQRATIGHNSRSSGPQSADDRLRLLIERIERLEEEKKGIGDDIKDVYAEAKAVGYDAKIMRQIIRLRKMKPDDRREMEMVLDTYKCAVGLE